MSHPILGKEFTILMALMMSIVAISIDALLPALGLIGAELKVAHENDIQLIIGFIFAGEAIGQLIAGPLSDALGRKPVLFAGIAFYLIGSILCYMAQDLNALLCGRLIQGFGLSAPYVTAMSVVRDKYSGEHMARIMSIVMMIFIIVPAIAPSLGQAVMYFADWRAIFVFYIVYSIAIGIWIALRLEETLPPERRTKIAISSFLREFKAVIGNRTTALYMLCMGLMFGSFIGYLAASQQIFQGQFGVGDSFALYFGGLALVLGVASLANSKLVMKFGMRRICHYAMGMVVISSALFLGLHFVVSAITLPMFLAYAAILFFMFGLMFGNVNAIAMEPMGDVAGMASAIIGCTSSILSIGLGTVIGQLYDNTLIPISAGFTILGACAWGLMYIEQKITH